MIRVIRILLSIMAVVVAVVPWFADYNHTHIFNEAWPPHARFHNAQTLMLAGVASVVALWLLWRPARGVDTRVFRFDAACFLTALYWLTATPGILFPGAAYEDPEHAGRLPTLLGLELNQTIIGFLWLGLVALLWCLGRRALRLEKG